MKHIFVINPKAGKKDLTAKISEIVKESFAENQYLIYVTKAPLDAEDFVRDYCKSHPEEELRFYSCGGDGTLSEVVNGAAGYPHAAVTCYPCGSGNDFIKYFGKAEDFLNLKALISGKERVIDLVKFNERYVVNIFNIGFDADVCERMIRYKRLPLVSGKGAYILGVIVSFFKKLTHHLRITLDGKEIFNGEGMLCAMANAICYGGGFYCAPHASVTDGLLDIVVVRKISRIKFLKFIKFYKRGEHLDKEELKKFIIYHQGKSVTIETGEPINCCFDGDIAKAKEFKINILPQALRFIVPENL
jgi:diacylglycerol kinase (ATP)